MAKPPITDGVKAKDLATIASLQCKAYYNNHGTFYNLINHFPVALFDRTGYIVFESEQLLKNNPNIQIGTRIHITRPGISGLHGYIHCPDVEKRTGVTPMLRAGLHGNFPEMKRLHQQGVPIDISDAEGWTPLHDAALFGYLPILEWLLQNNANPDARDLELGQTPAHKAAYSGHTQALVLLQQHQANLQTVDNLNCTPADVADMEGHTDTVAWLRKQK